MTTTTSDSAPGLRPWGDSGLDNAALEERVAGLAGRINAATCEWLGLIAEADDRYLWEGFPSCANWLSYQCGLGRGAASEHLRVARALGALPLIRDAFGRGRLSFSQVRALTRAPLDVGEQVLLDLARDATGAQLERLVRAMGQVASTLEEEDREVRQYADWYVDDDGTLVMRACLAGEDAAAVIAVLEEALTRSSDRRDALVELIRAAATAVPDRAAARASVTLVADVEAVREAVELIAAAEAGLEMLPAPSSAEDSTGRHIDDSRAHARWEPLGATASTLTLASLLCDRHVDVVARLADGAMVDLGRTRRRPTAAMSRAVLSRHDHACAVPRCGARRHLHLHHVHNWALGGATSVDNLIPLCGAHHRSLHRGRLVIERATDGKGWVFLDSQGVSRTRLRPPCDAPSLASDDAWNAADDAGRGIPLTQMRGARMQFRCAVGVLLQDLVRNRERGKAA